jgi:hypothetical protein
MLKWTCPSTATTRLGGQRTRAKLSKKGIGILSFGFAVMCKSAFPL